MDDRDAIEALLMTYAERVDGGDFAGAARYSSTAPGWSRRSGPDSAVRGSAAVQDLFERVTRVYGDGTPRTKDVISNVIIEIDGETATSRCYLTLFQQTDVLPLQPILVGRYHDRFEKVDGAWRFVERQVLGDLVGDLSQHKLGD